MKLIDADVLKQDVLSLPDCDNGFSDTYDKTLIISLIDEQDTVDAVPVVRCCNCDYAYQVCKNSEISICRYVAYSDVVYESDYCSRGKKGIIE